MRSTVLVAWLLGALCGGCGDTSNAGPSLTIDPPGPLDISGPTNFTATLTNDTSTVRWSVTGEGQLSAISGLHIILAPPTGSNTQTLTATTDDGLSASVEVSSSPQTLTGATIPGLAGPVTVQYDAEDIPHIKCSAVNDCIAVQGYIQARDRLFPMDFLRHVARAKLAELIGIAGLEQDVQLRTLFVTRAGHRLEDDLTAVMDPDTKAVVQRFADGVNAWLSDLRAAPQNLPGEYQQLPFLLSPADIADWTVEDTMALARLQQFQLSETIEEETGFGQFAQAWLAKDPHRITAWIRAAAPTTEQAHTLQPDTLQAAKKMAPTKLPGDMSKWQGALAQAHTRFDWLRRQLRPDGATVGSNNWVVAGTKSATGASMVANDPHLSLQYPPLFHLAVMTSSNPADNLDLAGGSFPGIPGALVGRGAHVGWGVTVVGYDVTDVYLEQFLPQASCPGGNAGPPCVLFNGAPTSTLPVPQTYLVRVGPGADLVNANSILPPASRPPPFVLIVPHHGPIIQAPDATGVGVSVRWTGHEGNTQDVKAILGLNTATDVDAAVLALKGFSTGAQNFVLADDQGHIAYDPHALVPVRQFADVTLHGAAVVPPWFPIKSDGSVGFSVEWGDGVSNCASATLTPVPATCWLADSALPFGKDPVKGYFFTANADPTQTGVSDDNNPLAHPPYMSFDWDDSTGFRATRINERLGDIIATKSAVSLDDMESVQADHVSRPGKVFTDIIATLPTTSDSANLTAARAMLQLWAVQGWDCPSGLLGSDPVNSAVDPDPIVATNSNACFLFHEFLRVLASNVFTDDLAVAGQGVNGLQALKAMIYMLDPATPGTDKAFCNDVNTSGTTVTAHTCEAQVLTALETAYDTLSAQLGDSNTWVWGRVHTIQPVSLLQLVTTNYSPGPYARPGGAFTVDVGSPSLSGSGLDFGYVAGGNVRHISVMDPGAPAVKMQLPGPERDTPALFVGPDLLGQWVANTYFDFAFGSQIDAAAVSTQSFTAQ